MRQVPRATRRARSRSKRLVASVLVAVMAAGVLAGCFPEARPVAIVYDFLLAWQRGDYAAAARETTGSTERVTTALRNFPEQVNASSVTLAIGRLRQEDDWAIAHFTVTIGVGRTGHDWHYRGSMRLRQDNGRWRVLWSPSVIHPRLEADQRLAVVSGLPRRAPVLGGNGEPLVKPTPVVVVGVQPSQLPESQRAVSTVSRMFELDTRRALSTVRAAPAKSFVPIVTLRQRVYQQVQPQLAALSGLRMRRTTLPLAPTPDFARPLLGQVGPATRKEVKRVKGSYQPGDHIGLSGLQLAFQSRLAGTPTTAIVVLDSYGRQVGVLERWKGRPSKPVRTTLDPRVQLAAERALDPLSRPAALVAVQASTGKILAAANRPTDGYNRAFEGHYRPGTAFTLISTDALLHAGMRTQTRIPCLPSRVVGGRTFHNFPGKSAGRAPTFATNFTESCNTAFVGLARRLGDKALPRAAARFGIGKGWKLPVPSFAGSVPQPRNDASKAAATIGQGQVRVSPLSMALVTAAIDSGTWRPPLLITKPPIEGRAKPRPLPGPELATLRELMRATVESGTAKAADLPGEPVYGKTGTAKSRSGEGSDAWFVGFRGDIAFALVVEDSGTGKEVAAPAAARFLRGLR